MSKPLLSIILSILLLIFATQNMNMVSIRFVVGPPIEMPLILVISGAFIGGFVLATINHLRRNAFGSRRKRKEGP
ncbi:MAG: LapA family protein [Magnetococcales bacterium]|nr:LapA family protein [Magnetococcales bacterium]